ncbi:aminopeptidase N [Streptomyces sp. YIM 98790]|uniref:aminopeptidase N n=1 Tax=Streptomyces sp. YIM 98790 TaxID=2689077 RepID=UPI00140D67B7|nr:aminopeptidase N [Streptomyces sp. YIM 98790]
MPTLTRDEAQTRARLLDVHRYRIDLDLSAAAGSGTFRSRTTVEFTARQAGDTFAELRPARLHHAGLDGRALDPAALRDGRLPLTGLTPGRHRLTVEADMEYSNTGEGMHRFTDPEDGRTYLYSMCCMAEAPRVYAAFDQPDLKAVFDVTVTAPGDWTVLGNGTATPLPAGPDGPPGAPVRHWRCATTPPISTYLMAVAAGPWHTVRTTHAGLPFALHVRQSLAEHLDKDAEEILDLTRRAFDRYHALFTEPYPFDSYDQAFVPEFNAGAMENPGLVLFRDEFIHRSAVTDTQRQTRGVVIAHEMAHMWFGNLVTLRWWDDIWLNESFAEYMGYQVLDDTTAFRPWTEFSVSRKSWGYDADQRPSTHPVAPEPDAVPDTASAWLNFDGISYAKGASALRQLVTWLGEDTFLAGINGHFARHRFGNATLADFLDSLGRATERDVHAWAGRWLRTTGPDTLTPVTEPSGGTGGTGGATGGGTGAGEPGTAPGAPGGWLLRVRHTGSRPHRIAVGGYDPTGAPVGEPFLLDLDAPGDTGTDAGTLTVPRPGARPDLLVLNDRDLSYTKVRLDPHSWHTARHCLSALPDPATRAVVWNAARDMVRDAELPPGAFLEAVREQLPAETDTALVEGVLAFARTQIADRYLDDGDDRDDRDGREDREEGNGRDGVGGPHRTAALHTLHATAQDLFDRAAGRPDGAALRLAAVRTLISTATEPGTLRRWWTAGTVPGGPELDPELRWQLLHRLAVLGAADAAEISAEETRDPGATGKEGAARCRAALPDPEAKAAAWEDMFSAEDRLSAYLFAATAQGFWHPEQRELLRPYVARYFELLPELAARRGHALAETACRQAFPRGFTDHRTLRLGEECLAGEGRTPTLRRNLGDQLDDLRRALRVRSSEQAAAHS